MNYFTEADVRAAIDDWRRKYRKTMLLKGIGWIVLTILICGGSALLAYALN